MGVAMRALIDYRRYRIRARARAKNRELHMEVPRFTSSIPTPIPYIHPLGTYTEDPYSPTTPMGVYGNTPIHLYMGIYHYRHIPL